MGALGAKISELRKARQLSQADLAVMVGVSQPRISRLEAASDDTPIDLRLLAKIANEFNFALSDVLPDDVAGDLRSHSGGSHFFAFCPNPFCDQNSHGLRDDGSPVVTWASGKNYAIESFGEVNFCHRCGTELVKECPSCARKLDRSGTMFCPQCGKRISERPTPVEWESIRKLHENRKGPEILTTRRRLTRSPVPRLQPSLPDEGIPDDAPPLDDVPPLTDDDIPF